MRGIDSPERLASREERDLSSAPLVNSFYFGHASRALFGAFHAPQVSPRSTAVLLCNPFGEEAVRAHRIHRVLATQLSRAGYGVLRFDYFGTGDSAGMGEEATLEEWTDNVATAAEELRRRTGVSRLAISGLRLGATIAALASPRITPHHLLLWDPVVEGAPYLRELAEAHTQYMSEELDEPQPPPPTSAEGWPEEALGHPLPHELARAIASVDLATAEVRADAITIVSTKVTAEAKRLEAALVHAKCITTTTSVPWNSDAAVNNAVVPMDVLKVLLARIEEVGR